MGRGVGDRASTWICRPASTAKPAAQGKCLRVAGFFGESSLYDGPRFIQTAEFELAGGQPEQAGNVIRRALQQGCEVGRGRLKLPLGLQHRSGTQTRVRLIRIQLQHCLVEL